jgi:hypothetical protein
MGMVQNDNKKNITTDHAEIVKIFPRRVVLALSPRRLTRSITTLTRTTAFLHDMNSRSILMSNHNTFDGGNGT